MPQQAYIRLIKETPFMDEEHHSGAAHNTLIMDESKLKTYECERHSSIKHV